MAIQIGATPDSGFDDPLGMLKDCHRRIEHFLNILCEVVERAAGRSLSEEEVAAVNSALHYFHAGGERHTADEEESLFPRLRAESAADSLTELGALESDHRDAYDLHAAIETLYTSWIAAGNLSPDNEQQLFAISARLKHLYEEHIKVEEKIVFPLAAKILDNEAIEAIGREFRRRRE